MAPLARLWRCPRCGRTRPGATTDARSPVCRYDLAEMVISRGGRSDVQGGRRNGKFSGPPIQQQQGGPKPQGFKRRRRRKPFNNNQPPTNQPPAADA